MKVRFQLVSLSAYGAGTHRIPINCWRLRIQYIPNNSVTVLLDGKQFLLDGVLDPVSGAFALLNFTAGGVFHPMTGAPVNLDQELFVTAGSGRTAKGTLTFEFIEP